MSQMPPKTMLTWARAILFAQVTCLLSAIGCADSDDRERWLTTTLIDDNRLELERSPELVAQKFRLMASTRYRYLRGTAAQFHRDIAHPSPTTASLPCLTAASSALWLVGDPHPENLGSSRREDGELVLVWNDFDAATQGAFHWDVWRLSLAFTVAFADLHPDSHSDLVDAVVAGYRDELSAASTATTAAGPGSDTPAGAIVDDLFRRARRDGDAQEALLEYTEQRGDGWVFRLGDIEPRQPSWFVDTLVPVTDAERRMLHAMLPDALGNRKDAPPSVGGTGPIVDVARRLGAGVSSYALPRYYVLIAGAAATPTILEFKLSTPAPVHIGLPNVAHERFRSNGERVVRLQRAMQPPAVAEPWATWADSGPLSFRVRERSKYQKNIDVARIEERIADGRWAHEDLVDFARLAGALLAQAHVAGARFDGHEVTSDIERCVRQPAFLDATQAWTRTALTQFDEDYLAFQRLLNERGPTLGYVGSTDTLRTR